MNWREKLPFLRWNDAGDGLVLDWDDGGKRCYGTIDGERVYPGDPRLAEYEAFVRRRLEEESKRGRKIIELVHDQIADIENPEPFPRDFLRKNPGFIAWLNRENPLYEPSVSEWHGLFVAYQERIRRLRERRLGAVDAPRAVGDEAEVDASGDGLSAEEKALAALVAHPGWTDAQIARHVGCSRTSLYRWDRYVKAREALRSGRENMPRADEI